MYLFKKNFFFSVVDLLLPEDKVAFALYSEKFGDLISKSSP